MTDHFVWHDLNTLLPVSRSERARPLAHGGVVSAIYREPLPEFYRKEALALVSRHGVEPVKKLLDELGGYRRFTDIPPGDRVAAMAELKRCLGEPT